jgi:hypothetical protein
MSDSSNEALIRRIEKFPLQLRFEQLRAWFVLSLVFSIFTALFLKALDLESTVSSKLASKLPLAFRLFVRLTAFAVFVWVCWKVIGRLSRWLRVLAIMFGARRNPFRVAGVGDVVAILRSGARFGLFLRAFGDESVFVPRSRETLPDALRAIDLAFIAVENARADVSLSGMHVLGVPNTQWRATVLELMALATVIMVDVNSGILHWMSDLPAEMGFVAREAEVKHRVGTATELEQIVSLDLVYKTVVLAPPGWSEMVASVEIARQIEREESAALERHAEILAARGKRATPQEVSNVEWFGQTRLKRALSRIARVAVSDAEAVGYAREISRGVESR